MADYSEHDDLARLGELRQLVPTEFAGFVEFDKIVGRTDGAVPPKYRELIAWRGADDAGPYCLDMHTGNARNAGATEAELAETVFIVAALRVGAAVTMARSRSSSSRTMGRARARLAHVYRAH